MPHPRTLVWRLRDGALLLCRGHRADQLPAALAVRLLIRDRALADPETDLLALDRDLASQLSRHRDTHFCDPLATPTKDVCEVCIWRGRLAALRDQLRSWVLELELPRGRLRSACRRWPPPMPAHERNLVSLKHFLAEDPRRQPAVTSSAAAVAGVVYGSRWRSAETGARGRADRRRWWTVGHIPLTSEVYAHRQDDDGEVRVWLIASEVSTASAERILGAAALARMHMRGSLLRIADELTARGRHHRTARRAHLTAVR